MVRNAQYQKIPAHMRCEPRPDEIMMELEDGQQGKIVVKEASGDTCGFLGSGPFPA